MLASYEITADQAAQITKLIFTDLAERKLTNEAKRVCERIGVNVDDLVEKSQ